MAKPERSLRPSFLSLPPELRTQIYQYIVIRDIPVIPQLKQISKTSTKTTSISLPQRPALAAACKTTRKEVLPFYYADNRFTLGLDRLRERRGTQDWDLGNWRRYLGDYVQDLRSVCVSFSTCYPLPRGYCSDRMRLSIHITRLTAALTQDGMVQLEHKKQWPNGECIKLCICKAGQQSATRYQRKDGRWMLDILEALLVATRALSENHRKLQAVDCRRCAGCGLLVLA